MSWKHDAHPELQPKLRAAPKPEFDRVFALISFSVRSSTLDCLPFSSVNMRRALLVAVVVCAVGVQSSWALGDVTKLQIGVKVP